jgi:HEAT repeat protein
MRRPLLLSAAALLLVVPAGRASADGDPADDVPTRLFFREPDADTTARIAELISKMPTNSVSDRTKTRRELETIGFWAVDPLIDVVTKREAPFRCDAILVLDAMRDRRAVDPLRGVVLKEAAQQYVSGFAALSLGRFRDAGSVDVFRAALRSPKSMDMFRAAAPFALVKIRTSEARDLVIDRVVHARGEKEPARSAALLSLGFFPDVALAADGVRPGDGLMAGLASKPSGERQAALLAFLVAAQGPGDSKQFLREHFATEAAPEVARIDLLGLSRSPDADVTELLAKTVEHQGARVVRELAADLLLDRVDASVKPSIMQTARNAPSARLRAACVLALGRLDDEDARRLVVDRLVDQAPIVRAAAAVALTRSRTAAARVDGLAAVEARIKRGETNDDVRADLEKARSLLAGERSDVLWTKFGGDDIFADMSLTYVQRLLREVNLRLMACLGLDKIQNLQTDSEIVPGGPPINPGTGESSGVGDTPPSGSVDGGGGGTGPDGGGKGEGPSPRNPSGSGSDGPSQSPPGDTPTVGAARTSQYQELRDLKVELMRLPYLTFADLPVPPSATTPAAPR